MGEVMDPTYVSLVDGKTELKIPDEIKGYTEGHMAPDGVTHYVTARDVKRGDPDWDWVLESWAFRQGYMDKARIGQ
jgi:hypothetical protein